MPSASLGSAGRGPAPQDLALTPRMRGSRARAGSHQGVCPQRVLELLTSLQAEKRPKTPQIASCPHVATQNCLQVPLGSPFAPQGALGARCGSSRAPEKG